MTEKTESASPLIHQWNEQETESTAIKEDKIIVGANLGEICLVDQVESIGIGR